MSTLVTRDKASLAAAFKELKRTELQALIAVHDLGNVNKTKAALEVVLAEHCATEHSGRAVNIHRCDLNKQSTTVTSTTMSASTSTARPAMPLRASQSSLRSLSSQQQQQQQQSNGPSVDKIAIEQLQRSVATLLERPSITEEQVIEIVEARLQQQREEWHTALEQLNNLCTAGFDSVQTSFAAVDEWREEINGAFANIQTWAKDVEQQIIQPAPVADTPAVVRPSRAASFASSSTPAMRTASLPLVSPAPSAISAISAQSHRRARFSEASDFSLATIPEQPASPIPASTRTSPKKSVDSSAQPLINRSPMRSKDANSPVCVKRVRLSSPQKPKSLVNSPAVMKKVTATPAAARTLFGTESDAVQRFGEAPVVDSLNNSVDVPHLWAPTFLGAAPPKLRFGLTHTVE